MYTVFISVMLLLLRLPYKVCIQYILVDNMSNKSDAIVRLTDDTHSELSELLYSEGNKIRKKLGIKRKQVSFNHAVKYLIEVYNEN